MGSIRRSARRRYLLPLLVLLALLAWHRYHPPVPVHPPVVSREPGQGGPVRAAFAARRSGLWLETDGTVLRILPDDKDGSRHQRMILDTGGITVLVAHNIDLAGRVPVSTPRPAGSRARWLDSQGRQAVPLAPGPGPVTAAADGSPGTGNDDPARCPAACGMEVVMTARLDTLYEEIIRDVGEDPATVQELAPAAVVL